MYKERFSKAITRTQAFGLAQPSIEYTSGQLLTDELQVEFPFMLRDEVGEIGIEELVGQCLSIHMKLRDSLSRIVKAPCYYTIGFVETVERNISYQTEESLKKILQTGIQSQTLDIHAWLTLPTMEIVDFSFLTSYAVANRDPRGLGGLIANHADALTGGMKYHPMLIGEDYLRKIGVLLDF